MDWVPCKQQKFISQRFRKLEVQDQGMSMVGKGPLLGGRLLIVSSLRGRRGEGFL